MKKAAAAGSRGGGQRKASAKKRGRGRPSLDLPPHLSPTQRLVLRANEVDLELWMEAAHRAGFPRAAFARKLLDDRMTELIPEQERDDIEEAVRRRVEYESTLTPKERKAAREKRQRERMTEAWQTESRLEQREAALERRRLPGGEAEKDEKAP